MKSNWADKKPSNIDLTTNFIRIHNKIKSMFYRGIIDKTIKLALVKILEFIFIIINS